MRRWLRLSALGAVALAACGEPTSAPQQGSQAVLVQQPGYSAAHPLFASSFAGPGEHVHVLPTHDGLKAFEASPFARVGALRTRGTGISYHGGPIAMRADSRGQQCARGAGAAVAR